MICLHPPPPSQTADCFGRALWILARIARLSEWHHHQTTLFRSTDPPAVVQSSRATCGALLLQLQSYGMVALSIYSECRGFFIQWIVLIVALRQLSNSGSDAWSRAKPLKVKALLLIVFNNSIIELFYSSCYTCIKCASICIPCTCGLVYICTAVMATAI